MHFQWSSEQIARREAFQTDVRSRICERVARRGADSFFDRDDWLACGSAGLLGLSIGTEHGGSGCGFLDTAYLFEAFAEVCDDRGLVFAAAAHLFACAMPVMEFGDDQLRGRTLPKLAAGEWVGANAITEAEAGSDVFSLQSTAVRDGDFYVLNGEKAFVTSGPLSDVVLTYATTNPDHGFFGLTAFLVERESAGVAVGETFRKVGLKSIPASSIAFRDCRVPVGNRVGRDGQGGVIFNRSMQWERSCLSALYLGMMQRQLDDTIDRAKSRKQFGKAIGKFQAVSHRIADMKFRLEAARLLLYQACAALDAGQKAALEVSLAKLAISEASVHSSLDAFRVFGWPGFLEEAGLMRSFGDALGGSIASGTADMQREIIAQELGL